LGSRRIGGLQKGIVFISEALTLKNNANKPLS